MFKSLALGALLATGFLGYSATDNRSDAVSEAEAATSNTVQVNEDTTIELDVFYMYSNDEGAYFLDPSAEFENVIFVGFDSLEEWNIEFDELHHGNKFVGTFDSTGWDLLGLEYAE